MFQNQFWDKWWVIFIHLLSFAYLVHHTQGYNLEAHEIQEDDIMIFDSFQKHMRGRNLAVYGSTGLDPDTVTSWVTPIAQKCSVTGSSACCENQGFGPICATCSDCSTNTHQNCDMTLSSCGSLSYCNSEIYVNTASSFLTNTMNYN